MASAVGKCQICGEQLCYKPDDVNAFGRHLLEKHHEEPITHFSFGGIPQTENKNVCECKCEHCSCSCNTDKRKRGHKKAYKTTVESWKQGAVAQECPNCGKVGLPLIRKQRNKVSRNSFGTLCLVGCWPLCFLPFLLGGSDVMYLFCQECGYFLGTYNRKDGRICQSCPIDSNEYGAKICKCDHQVKQTPS
ncbi:uncharacterized protein [Onthophagus taurus]|uniref:uncharacterized protein n=1 Tax=Onthophagus taurus TaxID=166361 RepID=UPI000C2028DA|nr:uncharacterized protein LOC111419318 [Onthophagus taurus]